MGKQGGSQHRGTGTGELLQFGEILGLCGRRRGSRPLPQIDFL